MLDKGHSTFKCLFDENEPASLDEAQISENWMAAMQFE